VKVLINLALLVLLCFVGSVQAQESQNSSSKVSGRVYDRNGSVIVGASVRFIDKKRNVAEGRTDEEGGYRLDLQPGFYTLEIAEVGFYKFTLNCYQIPSSAKLSLDVTLTVGGEGKCEACPSAKVRQDSKRDKKVIIE
jgi:hypothetical protein